MKAKLRYFVDSGARTLARKNLACPSCGSDVSKVVARKHLVTALRRCEACHLLFRAPTTPPAEFDSYYQSSYTSGLTTSLPDESRLNDYLGKGFYGTEKDFSRYIDILEALDVKPNSRILDYGCSWGYGCWQLRERGFDASGFELSRSRSEYGREKLGLNIASDANQIKGSYDVFFSTHVVEHVPEMSHLLEYAFRMLASGGLFIAVTPNGSLRYRERCPGNWLRVWGYKHPVLLDEVYLSHALGGCSYLLTTQLRDFGRMRTWSSSGGEDIQDMTGWELLVVARKESQCRSTT